MLCCVRVARQRKGELWTWKYAVEPSPGKLLFYLGAGAACDVPLFVFVQFIHQQRQQRDHIILRWKFILLLRSLSLASSIARELKRWRFIIPCRAATAKNSRENEFTECVSVCEKYTANRCARYHERKEWEQTSIFLIPAMLLNVYYVWSTYTHQYSGDAAAAVINTVWQIFILTARTVIISWRRIFYRGTCVLCRRAGGRELFLRPCGISTAFAFINEKIKSNCPRPRLWGA